MKKSILSIIALAALGFASCKKDYTCTCTNTAGGITSTSAVVIHDTKDNATTTCNNSANIVAPGGSQSCSLQ